MKNLRNIIIILIIIVAIAGGGFTAYIYFSGGSGEVSTDIGDVAQRIEDAEAGTLFRIVPEDSEAIFSLQEDLMGVRGTVVGRTTQVGGDIVVDFDNPQASAVGTITINARNFATDREMRNRAIRSEILLTNQDENEFIEFVPTAINGLPDSIAIGETYTFEIVGDLSIIDTTNEVTFATTVTIDSETQISGSATANVMYADWGITVPPAMGVANVSEDVTLEINFEAELVTDTEEDA